MNLYEILDLIVNILVLLVTGIVAYLVYEQTKKNTEKQIDFEKERHNQEIRMRTYEDKRQLYHFASRMTALATLILDCKSPDNTEEGMVIDHNNSYDYATKRFSLKIDEIGMFEDIAQLVLEDDILEKFNLFCLQIRNIDAYIIEFYAAEIIGKYKEAIGYIDKIDECSKLAISFNIVDLLRERIRVDV